MSSTYAINFLLFGGFEISDAYILNSVGESTPHCGTPVLIVPYFEFALLYNVNCLRHRM